MPHSSFLSCLLPLLVLSRLAPYRSNACAVDTAVCHPGAPACYPYRPALSPLLLYLTISLPFSPSPTQFSAFGISWPSLSLPLSLPTFSPSSPFGDFSLHLPTLPHHALHFAQWVRLGPFPWGWWPYLGTCNPLVPRTLWSIQPHSPQVFLLSIFCATYLAGTKQARRKRQASKGKTFKGPLCYTFASSPFIFNYN